MLQKNKAASFFFSELWHDKKTFGKAELKSMKLRFFSKAYIYHLCGMDV